MTTPALYTFKTKPVTWEVLGRDETETRINMPAKLSRSHVDMAAMRRHKRYGSLANSDLFLSMLARDIRRAGIPDRLDGAALPVGVTVDYSGFLATVTIDLDVALAAVAVPA